MAVKSALIATEGTHMPQSCSQSMTAKEESSGLETADVKLESELLLSDFEDEAHSQEIIPANLTQESNAVVVPERTLKIILKRCDDAGETSRFNSEQSTASEEMNVNCSVAPAFRIKVETESESAKTVGSESYIACSNDGIRVVEGNDIVSEQSSSSSAENISTTKVPRRVAKIICKRCDVEERSKLEAGQRSVPKIESENFSDAVPVSVKIENAFESMETVKSETHNTDANDSDQTAVGNGEQSDRLLQANPFVKIEKEESAIVSELVGHLPKSSGNEYCDKKPLLKIIKLEEGKLHAAVCLKMTEDKEDGTAKAAERNLMDDCLECSACVLDDAIEAPVDEPLSIRLQSNACVRSEEEKSRVTKELVSSLPGSSTLREHDKKYGSKIVKLAETGTGVESEPQSDAYSTIVSTSACTGKTSSGILVSKNKVLSEIGSGKNSVKKLYSCTECPYRRHKQSNLIMHLRVHSRERPFECKKCAKKFKEKCKLKRHMTTHTNEKPFGCKDCSARFKSKSYLVQHLRRHSDERRYSCSMCPSKFKTKAELKQHSTAHTTERRFECAHCSHRFKSKRVLRKHVRIHVDEKLCSCPYCPSTFCLPDYLKSHIVLKHSSSERLYTCVHCSTKFKLKGNLVRHMALHSNEKPHSCPECPMTFKRMGNLNIHLRHHTGEKPYSCQQCPAKFSQSGSLKKHLRLHSNEKRFSCDQCLDSFTSNAQLNRHKKTHEAERIYCCAHCPHRSKTKDALSMHIKQIHIGNEKRHACSQCSYRTYRSSNLKQHLLVHSGEKPYACVYCPSKFSQKIHLTRHSKRHLQEKFTSG